MTPNFFRQWKEIVFPSDDGVFNNLDDSISETVEKF